MLLRSRSATVPGSDFRIVMLGDSITAFYWYQYMAATVELNAIAAGAAYAGPTGGASITTGLVPTACHTWINSGIAGDDCSCILGDTVAARVTAHKPDAVFLFLGVNCWQHGPDGPFPAGGRYGVLTTDAYCTTAHPQIMADMQGQIPGIPILVMGPLCDGEQWPNGANSPDPGLDAKNAICRSATLGAASEFVDLRTPFFAYEAANNPGNLPLGILTADGIHPNATGQVWVGQQVLPLLSYAR